MSTMKLAATMLAATGVAGSANAAFTTTYLFMGPTVSVGPVTIGGADVFTYGGTLSENYNKQHVFTGHSGYAGGLYPINGSGIGGFSATPTLPAANESYLGPYDGVILSSVDDRRDKNNNFAGYNVLLNTPGGDQYLHVRFTDAAGPEVGYFTLGANGSLDAITYRSAVPEPAAWALMFGGVALTGGALRRSRRRAPLRT